MIWQQRRWLLIAVGLFLAVNLLVFFTYRVRQQERINELKARKVSLQERLATVEGQRKNRESQLEQYRRTQSDIQHIYNVRWSTPGERLTPLLLELRSLAERSRMQPRTRSYALTEERAAQALGTSSLVISFGVQGNYQQVRQLINMIELSDQFVFIDEISLSGDTASPALLNVNLRLKTLFREDEGTGDRS